MKKKDHFQGLLQQLEHCSKKSSAMDILTNFLKNEAGYSDFKVKSFKKDLCDCPGVSDQKDFFLLDDYEEVFILAFDKELKGKDLWLLESIVNLFRIHMEIKITDSSPVVDILKILSNFYKNFPGVLTIKNSHGEQEYVNEFTERNFNMGQTFKKNNKIKEIQGEEQSFISENKEILEKGYVTYPDFYVNNDGKLQNFENHAFLIEEDQKKWIAVLGIDVTEKVRMENSLKELAYKDSLTGLYNYNYFIKKIEEMLTEKDNFSLVYMDINRFRKINEVHGFEVGDKVLQHFVMMIHHFILQKTKSKQIIPFRFKDDEFIILFIDFDKELAVNLTKEMLLFLSAGVVINEILYKLDFVAGISSFPEDGIIKESLLRKAAIAKNKAKESSENNFIVFSKELEKEIKKEYEIESGIHMALINNEFELYLQPVYSRSEQKTVKAEALIRWNHPSLGVVMPLDFIAVAEKSNLILKIGEWVIDQTCQNLKKWEYKNIKIPISVNISGKQLLQYKFPEFIEEVVKKYDIDPTRLMLEITENSVFEEEKQLEDTILKLNRMGISFSIDDFGTGYSTLLKLRHMNVSEIKIDKSFISGMLGNDTDVHLIKSVITLAKDLEIDVVAEGVETVEQYMFLKELGCDLLQGYLFSIPLRIKEFEGVLSKDFLWIDNEPDNPALQLTWDKNIQLRKNKSKYKAENYLAGFDCKKVLDQLASSVIITDTDGAIEYVNKRFVDLSGFSSEELIGQNPRILSSGLIPKHIFKNLWETILSGKEWQGELHNRRKNKETYWQLAKINPIVTDGNIDHFIAILEDITEKKTFEKRLRYLAKIDPMTGALNRAAGMEFLELFFDEGILNKENITLIFIDLDNLKDINDTFGHNKGDEAIKVVAEIIKKNIKKDCLFIRYGGDEFLIVLRDTDTLIEEFTVNRIHVDLGIKSRDFTFPIEISTGIARLGEISEDNLEEMIKRADKRMYQNKNKKKRR